MPINPGHLRGFYKTRWAFYILCVLPVRFLKGGELNGHSRTNATWRLRGTVPTMNNDRPSWWSYQPVWHRAVYRWLITGIIGWTVYGWYYIPEPTYTTWRAVFWSIVMYLVYLMFVKSRRRDHYHKYVKSTADSIRERFGINRHVAARDFIRVPVGHRDNPERPVVIHLPKTFSQDETTRDRNAKFVAEKLDMEEPVYHYEVSGSEPKLVIASAPFPPERVEYDDIIKHYDASAHHEWILGLGKGYRPMVISFERDSPHILLSMASGGGKSEFCKGIALQALHKSFRVVILDAVKRGESCLWAKYLDGIEIITTIAEQHDFLVSTSEEVIGRQDRSYQTDGKSRKEDKPTLIIFEEANTAMAQLSDYWRTTAPNVQDATKMGNRSGTSPAVTAIRHILNAGRSAQTHLLTVAQRAEANVCGGGAARENYGIRVANRYQLSTAKMLFPDVDPLPVSPGEPGRVQVVVNGKAYLTQTPYFSRSGDEFFTHAGILRWACPHGQSVPGAEIDREWFGLDTDVLPGDGLAAHGQGLGDAETEHLDPYISLSQALSQGVVTAPSLGALQKRRQRDTSFPLPEYRDTGTNTDYYSRDALAAWEERRG